MIGDHLRLQSWPDQWYTEPATGSVEKERRAGGWAGRGQVSLRNAHDPSPFVCEGVHAELISAMEKPANKVKNMTTSQPQTMTTGPPDARPVP